MAAASKTRRTSCGPSSITALLFYATTRTLLMLPLIARIFHSLSHRYDHLPAGGSYDGGSQGICGLVSKPPLRGEIMRPRTTENSSLAQENPRNLAGLLAERSGGGFASSPDVPASALGPRIIDSLHAGCRVERETSGLEFEERRARARADDRETALERRQHAGTGGFHGGGTVAFAAEV